jgi:hypothetical protein
VPRVDDGDSVQVARPSLAGWSSGAALFAVVAALTAAIHAHTLSIGPFASSAARVAAGKLWLLVSSALVIDRPVAVGLVAFGLIAAAALRVCGARTFWVTAVAGHVGSTLLVYAIIGLSRLADPHLFSSAVATPDFGVSAMQGAWVGALAATAWLRSGSALGPRAATAVAVCIVAGVAWLLHPDPSVLTFEHVFAFLIGASIVWAGNGRVGNPVPLLREAGGAALARLRSAPVSVGYLLILCVTTGWLMTETDRAADRLLLSRSTNLDHLGRDPARVVVASAFWLSSSWRPLCVTALLLIGLVARVERRIGSRRTVVVLAAGHVGATLLTAAGLWIAVRLGAVAPSVAHARDVGPSYAIFAAAACLTYLLAPRRRLPYLAAVLLYAAVPGIVSTSFSDVGHLLSIGIGLSCYRLVRTASGRPSDVAERVPGFAPE